MPLIDILIEHAKNSDDVICERYGNHWPEQPRV